MDERLFHKLAQEVADDFQMGGLTGCVYEDYAKEILARYLAAEQPLQSDVCHNCGTHYVLAGRFVDGMKICSVCGKRR